MAKLSAITEQTLIADALQAITWDISLLPLCAVSDLSFSQFKAMLFIPGDLDAILISPSFPLQDRVKGNTEFNLHHFC